MRLESGVISFLAVFSSFICLANSLREQNNGLVCLNSFAENPRNEEKIKCVTSDGSISLMFECKLLKDYKLKKGNADVIKAQLTLSPAQVGLTESVFFWNQEEFEPEPQQKTSVANSTVPLSINAFNQSYSQMVLYGIKEDIFYKVCNQIPGVVEDPVVCCTIETVHHEEDTNIYMVLIVIGILLILYLIIVLVFWLCPPTAYDSIDDMLTNLPSSHVEKLKNLVSGMNNEDDDSVYSDEEDKWVNDTDTKKGKKLRPKVRIDEHFVEIDNPAYETSDESEQEAPEPIPKKIIKDNQRARRMSRVSFGGRDDADIEHDLIKEAQKFRRMSRMSVGSIKVVAAANSKGVKFANADTVLNVNDMEDLKVRIFNESKRRESIKPFKKPFDLEISDSD